MRVFAFALAVLVTLVAALASAQSKNICVPIRINSTTINPSNIPTSIITGMTDRGQGSYTLTFNLCAAAAGIACKSSAFLRVSNSSGCVASFDTPLARPTANANGFSVQYGSSVNKNDDAEVTVRCDPSAGAALQSKSKKFATMSPNKKGGRTYLIVVESNVPCPAAPRASCRPVTVLGQTVDASQWQPSALTLDIGFTGQWTWLFSICSASAAVPSFLPTCSPTGFAVKYNGDTCAGQSFDRFVSFGVVRNHIQAVYGSSTNPTDRAVVDIGCIQGTNQLISPNGTYTSANNSMGGKTYTFPLGIQDLCGGATWTPAPLPPWTTTPGGSGSSALPPTPSGGSGSSGMPPVPSSEMPSGNSSSSIPTGSGSSNMPSSAAPSGSGTSGVPSA